MNDPWVLGVLAIIASLVASGGLWSFLEKRSNKLNAITRLVLGLAHDRIVFLGMSYVDRGWITQDEYEDYIKYLYEPYAETGGNGLAERVMRMVDDLPMRNRTNKDQHN